MQSGLINLFMLFSVFFCSTAYSEWNNTGFVGVTSQYVGIVQQVLNNNPVIQSDLHTTESNSGIYIDMFGTFGLTKQNGNEIDLAVGTTKKNESIIFVVEADAYTIIEPQIVILAPILKIEHSSGLYAGIEGRNYQNLNGYHIEVGYKTDWWNAELRKINFWGDNLIVAKLNLFQKIDKNLTVTVSLAKPFGDPMKKSSATLNISRNF